MLKTTLDQVLARRLSWLKRYGIPEDTARQRITELKDLLTVTAKEARDAQDDEIRNRPISEPAVSSGLDQCVSMVAPWLLGCPVTPRHPRYLQRSRGYQRPDRVAAPQHVLALLET